MTVTAVRRLVPAILLLVFIGKTPCVADQQRIGTNSGIPITIETTLSQDARIMENSSARLHVSTPIGIGVSLRFFERIQLEASLPLYSRLIIRSDAGVRYVLACGSPDFSVGVEFPLFFDARASIKGGYAAPVGDLLNSSIPDSVRWWRVDSHLIYMSAAIAFLRDPVVVAIGIRADGDLAADTLLSRSVPVTSTGYIGIAEVLNGIVSWGAVLRASLAIPGDHSLHGSSPLPRCTSEVTVYLECSAEHGGIRLAFIKAIAPTSHTGGVRVEIKHHFGR